MRWSSAILLVAVVATACSGTSSEGPDDAAASSTTSSEAGASGLGEMTTTSLPTTGSTAPDQPADGPTTTTSTTEVAIATTTTGGVVTPTTGAPGEPTGENPPVPLNDAASIGKGWFVSVVAAELDATEQVLAYADFNPPPAPGDQYVLISLSGRYTGGRSAQPVFLWSLVNGDIEVTPRGVGCGLIPDSLFDVAEMKAGGTFTANICIPTPSTIVDEELRLLLGPAGEVGTFFALTE